MATVVLDRITYVRSLSEDLGGGVAATATLTATGVKAADDSITKSTAISVQQPAMNEAQLAVFQTFVAGLDEIAQELEDALYVETGP